MYKFKLALIFVLLLLAATSLAAEDDVWDNWDGRINVITHFGGDALYCNETDGCWLLNMDGERLWSIEQSAIDAAMSEACESGVSVSIAVGVGTYGMNYLLVHCYAGYDPMLTLTGYDEWGALNTMDFTPNYLPVGPALDTVDDTDGDGINDDVDVCPTIPGPAPHGCPLAV